jgi:hypothetical protein
MEASSLPPVFLPSGAEGAPSERAPGARFVVHARHRRYRHEYRDRNTATRTEASWGTTRVRVERVRDGATPPPGALEVEAEGVKESFREWWWAMADRFPGGTPPEDLCFDFDKAWWVRVPPGGVLPWVGTLDDRDWDLDPVEGMRKIRGQLSDAMRGIAPEVDPPEWKEWVDYDGHGQVVDDDWLYGTPEDPRASQ